MLTGSVGRDSVMNSGEKGCPGNLGLTRKRIQEKMLGFPGRRSAREARGRTVFSPHSYRRLEMRPGRPLLFSLDLAPRVTWLHVMIPERTPAHARAGSAGRSWLQVGGGATGDVHTSSSLCVDEGPHGPLRGGDDANSRTARPLVPPGLRLRTLKDPEQFSR